MLVSSVWLIVWVISFPRAQGVFTIHFICTIGTVRVLVTFQGQLLALTNKIYISSVSWICSPGILFYWVLYR